MSLTLIPGWLPPSRENWQLISFAWQFFPLVRTHHVHEENHC